MPCAIYNHYPVHLMSPGQDILSPSQGYRERGCLAPGADFWAPSGDPDVSPWSDLFPAPPPLDTTGPEERLQLRGPWCCVPGAGDPTNRNLNNFQ